ncbi:MarR family winged helix-turn-helix transcriptional regulator [Nakamurella endophytica]|uniref:MarR family transcriptional regulator n=1 Tax=Nakamurella endophytica TaxID=1748367 RepID=A0A917SSQ9_9ACTN|nr:MarR family transcriptional regulator [Nakamurella endophytica]GGL94313.1 MarR family transcriptional regulator [Nakamurella endophytica]
MPTNGPALAAGILQLSAQLVDGIQQGLRDRGFHDVRPVHGYAFARLSGAPATASDLAAHLGVTKQAAAQLADHLVTRGYLRREPDPTDRRARLLVLTERGRACTAAADAAADDVVRGWGGRLGAGEVDRLAAAVHALAVPGRLRPAW